jgi:hypothetical protein
MQPMNSAKHTKLTMWWPHPDAFQDLTVEDVENGFDLSAPDGTECADWLRFWAQDVTHHEFFERTFIQILVDHVNHLEQQHGETEITDWCQSDREQAEDVGARL